MMRKIHLDLGCGARPRNPYGHEELHGIDIRLPDALLEGVQIKLANLAIDKIPYSDSYFDSVSAFDFIEHIPRVLNGGQYGTRFPFIELMNEIWRVLKADGLFYALTPAYPSEEVFVDPTHVNFITENTHAYFCEGRCYGKNYGFHGVFEVKRVDWVYPRLHYVAAVNHRTRMKSLFRTLKFKPKTHLLWELRAVKSNA